LLIGEQGWLDERVRNEPEGLPYFGSEGT